MVKIRQRVNVLFANRRAHYKYRIVPFNFSFLNKKAVQTIHLVYTANFMYLFLLIVLVTLAIHSIGHLVSLSSHLIPLAIVVLLHGLGI